MSYAMWPLAFMMGVPQEDCLTVGLLIGTSLRTERTRTEGRWSRWNCRKGCWSLPVIWSYAYVFRLL